MMRAFVQAVVAIAVLVIGSPSRAQALQSATVRLISCSSRPSEIPILELTDSGHRTQRFGGTQDAHHVWTFTFHMTPGTYELSAAIPYKAGHPGCIYLTRFTALPGHERHLVGALASASRIGGENYYRSVYGTLPFGGMYVTVQATDLPHAPEMLVPVDGTMYDAELLGPHPYVLRFYLTPQDMEGTKFARVEIDLRDTAPMTKVRRDLTVGDLASSDAP